MLVTPSLLEENAVNRDSIWQRSSAVVLSVAIAFLTGCSSDPASPTVRIDDVRLAKASAGVSVTAANPNVGHDGDVGVVVTITGSGFVAGAQPAWERGGVADSKIQVVSATVVSSTQLTATINIAPDATIDLYDVSVTNPDKKKGIGYLLFEVTQATAISGTEIAYGATDAGEVTGRAGVPGVFFFAPATGVDTLGSPGRGFDISADGRTIVGGTTINALNDHPYIYTFDGATWTYAALPKNASATMTRPLSVASDPTTGAPTLIGGWDSQGSTGPNNLNRRPRLWVPDVGGWTRVELTSTGTDDLVEDVSATSVAVGSANGRAAVWMPNGTGGWTAPVFIGPAGSDIHGVNSAGTIAVGVSGSAAVYWTNSGGVWSAALSIGGGCTSAQAIDDNARIVVNGCPKGARRVPGLVTAPYAGANVTLLGGLGDNANTTVAQNISRGGATIVGQSTVKNQATGVFWRLP